MKTIFFFLVFLFLHTTISKVEGQPQSQEATPPCLRPEHKQIAFLKGDWDVVSRQRVNFTEDRWEESQAQATWKPVLNGCALQEHWSGTVGGDSLEWIQLLAYDHREDIWEKVMIDWGHGNVITSEGYYDDGKLIFNVPHMRSGKLLIDRTTIEKAGADRFTWTMETSRDGGKTWVTFWKLVYSRQ